MKKHKILDLEDLLVRFGQKVEEQKIKKVLFFH